jgi:hypothetical protein
VLRRDSLIPFRSEGGSSAQAAAGAGSYQVDHGMYLNADVSETCSSGTTRRLE